MFSKWQKGTWAERDVDGGMQPAGRSLDMSYFQNQEF